MQSGILKDYITLKQLFPETIVSLIHIVVPHVCLNVKHCVAIITFLIQWKHGQCIVNENRDKQVLWVIITV